MSTAQVEWAIGPRLHPAESVLAEEPRWYAIQTRCRFEKKVATQLQNKGIETFLPLVKEVHRWSDRRQVIELPLFPGYGFVRASLSPYCQLRIVQTAGVYGFIAMNGLPAPIPDRQIEDVQRLLSHEISCKAYPFLRAGQRVRIRGGCFDGLEGILVSENEDHSLVISIEAIQRSLAIRIEGYDVQPV
jgi:transcription antitermination factor NusG